MLPFQQRVADEKAELDERLEKLRAFISGSAFRDLSSPEQERLTTQQLLMTALSQVLSFRIAAFS